MALFVAKRHARARSEKSGKHSSESGSTDEEASVGSIGSLLEEGSCGQSDTSRSARHVGINHVVTRVDSSVDVSVGRVGSVGDTEHGVSRAEDGFLVKSGTGVSIVDEEVDNGVDTIVVTGNDGLS